MIARIVAVAVGVGILQSGAAHAQSAPGPLPSRFADLGVGQIPVAAPNDPSGLSHWVAAVQIGASNRLTLEQASDGPNQASVSQIGTGNEIDLTQDGAGNVALLSQTGDDNRMRVEQQGDANHLTWTQTGDHLGQPAIVMPGGVTLSITQTGPF
ncbi:MAG: hypothetical protein EON90_11385 [Brevundimonas sp.]|nr:MAG: hypothetical protein EON90_11385 [Brevundimonas sp.]